MAGLKVSEVDMKDVRILLFGSGTAGTGIADQIKDAVALNTDKSKEDAGRQIWSVVSISLLTTIC